MKSLMLVLMLVLAPAVAWAHPHAFVEASVTMVFDEQGLAGFQQVWELDPMLTITVFDLIAENHDGKLDAREVKALEKESFINLKEYGYFNQIRIDGKPFKALWAKDFDASLKDGKVAYTFFVPCHVPADSKKKTVLIALYDESFYTYISYKSEGGPKIDPTRDPLFANQQTGPNPNDFARFSEAVGDTSYDGDVYLLGPVEGFDIAASVEDTPSMAYFYDQIVPQAFHVEFSKK